MSLLKYPLWLPLMFFALWWLVRGGRLTTPEGRGSERFYPRRVFLRALVVTVVVFGFLLGKDPNPVEPVMGIVGEGRGAAALLFFSALAVVGNKLICGWGCPFGALEELLYEVPLFRKAKRNQLPFFLTMPVRTLAFGAFVIALLGWRSDLYAVIDPFDLFTPERARTSALIAAAFLLALSLAVYRPFCQLLCPFGWYSWFLERLSLFRIRINRRTCIRCNACARACPLEAARGRLLNSPIPADCFSCARCLRVCPTGAVHYGRCESR